MRLIATMGTAALLMTATSMAQVSITEVRTGSFNTEYIEFKGAPGTSLGGMTLLVIGDGTGGSGVVEWRYPFAATDVIGPNGYLVLRNPGDDVPPFVDGNGDGANDNLQRPFGLVVDSGATDLPWPRVAGNWNADVTQLEGGDNQTYLLVSGYNGTDTFVTRAPNSGSNGQDLDTNDDGVLDVTPWASIVDSMVMKQSNGSTPGSGNEWWYETNAARWCGPFESRSVQTVTTGGIVGVWTFNLTGLLPALSSGDGDRFQANRFPMAPESGDQAATALLSLGGGTVADLATDTGGNSYFNWLRSFTGTTTNAPAGALAGGALSIRNGTAGGNNGSYVELSFTMAGLQGMKVTWAAQRTSSGFNSVQASYSLDGTTFTDFGTAITYPTSFGTAVQTVDFGNLLDNAASVKVRLTGSGGSTTSTSGNNRLDNITLLSNQTTAQVVVSTYASPVHGLKSAQGGWVIGNLTPAADSFDTPGKDNAVIPTFACGDAGAGDCAVAHGNGGCSDQCCCESVCATDPFCCDVRWDAICATAAAGCVGGGDCGGSECPADLNGDASVDGQDLGVLLGNWGAGGATDLNGDGSVDGQDLGIMLGAWGPCAG